MWKQFRGQSVYQSDQLDLNVNSKVSWRSRPIYKMLAMYLTMVVVSTTAIYLLEHSTLVNAFRTALVAAIGKTLAANWVSGIFD
ncbi:MAG: hypothetical protein AAF939_12410 [Planctomycetota bacterium]